MNNCEYFPFQFMTVSSIAYSPLRSRTTKNPDVSSGPFAHLFTRLLTPLIHSLSPQCSLRLRTPLRSMACSLYSLTHFRAREEVNDSWWDIRLFLNHSASWISAQMSQSAGFLCRFSRFSLPFLPDRFAGAYSMTIADDE